MRVVFDVIRDGLFAINSTLEQMADARQQVTTGRRINALSDDPVGVVQAVGEHTTMASIDAYTSTADAASARLAAADTILNGFVDKLTASITTAAAARGSTSTPDSRAAYAQQLRGYRDSLLGDINSKFGGNFLFSGSEVTTAAYAQVAGVWTYQGDAAPVQLEVEHGRLVSVTLDGQTLVQGSDPANLFTVLDDLATAIDNNDQAGIQAGMDALDRAFDRAVQAQSRVGIDERGTDDATARLAALRLASEKRRSGIEDANLAEAIAKMNQADTSYRAALGAVSSAERLSLLDYLK
jgi:flagellar hook-associated protein 3 FlgL